MAIIYAGDTHGMPAAFERIDRNANKAGVKHVVQVGDFGVFFSQGQNDNSYRFFAKRARQGREGPTWWTCGGNHDNYPYWNKLAEEQGNPAVVQLAPGVNWVRRGETVVVDGLRLTFIGGAESTDRHYRTEGLDWWPEESPSYNELMKFHNALENDAPDVVVSHDAPLRVLANPNRQAGQPTPQGLENALKLSGYVPPLWYFGHHHQCAEWAIEGTVYRCVGLNGDYWCDSEGFNIVKHNES